MKNEKENHREKGVAEEQPAISSTVEKAQFEVFTNGSLPRETLEKWIRNDLSAVASFADACLKEPEIMKAVVDVYYNRYVKLHPKE